MDPRMMNEWLKAQAQKPQMSTRSMEQKRQGMAITEQLNAQEEKYAKSHKSMLTNMIKQYGEQKGTNVFYAKVRQDVKKLNEAVMLGDLSTRIVSSPSGLNRTEPRSPESAANLARRIQNLADVAGFSDINKAKRAAASLVSKGIGAKTPTPKDPKNTDLEYAMDNVMRAAAKGEDLIAGNISDKTREDANLNQLGRSGIDQIKRKETAKRLAPQNKIIATNTISTRRQQPMQSTLVY